ncbi:MAG: hypothetical protein A3G33_07520 [Omnitrophica bacterium RIFCSPLOWO2_12_FULL_44_17]|uniref:Helix-turn-helix domain-containing protein n=1 Tax=Candidatus Danuiimicrobium aquiferis TaxID=1801832 RepID=A0A1G1KYT6_9BACT|nr:MAG: hypothetical protein A3B72_07820 [Omnitrophica bacterium RIFCSPHIGHO2_02_FULL_45_28]OGW92154.1 MAG: hypothetical protein A3E74_10320 [Omnitrophica bacterium RIFCSPHIGHO2_12_FULL_44_12]OGW98068.1 MAG: hypothetical protein A3G33_07520 [Omnitrophica bacterium RIFCSPLOWO2_12_FULL_44_17]OGX03490.1 MAG: hypothetical protein A3J12_02710 [Omnitrophica bacterium RIFCSPLOWO2_02_FULL_44_11]
MIHKQILRRLIFAPEGYLDLDGASIFTSIPKGTLRKYLRYEPERFLIHGKVNRSRPALCRVGKRILISVEALHSFLKTKEMIPARLIEYARAA